MAEQSNPTLELRPMRWHVADWAWLGEVAKSVGLSRSEFVRRSALLAASSAVAGLIPYSVGAATAAPQNTRPNPFDHSIAQQGDGRMGGGGEPNHARPGGDSGTNSGGIGAARGKNLTNGAKPKARKAKVLRS